MRRLVFVVTWGLALLVPVFLMLAMSTVTVPAASADGANIFSGVVQDASGNPVSNIELDLWTASGSELAWATTGQDGSFSMSAPAGTYTVRMG